VTDWFGQLFQNSWSSGSGAIAADRHRHRELVNLDVMQDGADPDIDAVRRGVFLDDHHALIQRPGAVSAHDRAAPACELDDKPAERSARLTILSRPVEWRYVHDSDLARVHAHVTRRRVRSPAYGRRPGASTRC
jgi:hypothetical protein